MAITNIVSFDTGDATELFSASNTFAYSTTTKRTGSHSFQANPTTTGTGWCGVGRFDSAGLHTNTPALASYAVVFYFRYATKPSINNEPIWTIHAAASTTARDELRLGSDGKLSWYVFGPTLVATGSKVLAANIWYRIEIAVTTAGSATAEVRVDGVRDGALTAMSTTGTVCMMGFGKRTNRNGNTVDFFYDDIAINNDGSYIGDGRCRLSRAIGAGAASDWNDGTSTAFTAVNETTPDGDTSYVATDLNGDNLDHTFDMQTYATTGAEGSIQAVKTLVVARTDSTTGTSSVAHRRIYNGSGFEATALELTTSYQTLSVIDQTDPSGAGAITSADFDTIEVGMAANTIAQTQRFTFVAAVLLLNEPLAAVTGTVTAAITEANVVAGGKTIIITITNDTWVTSGATFDAVRQDIIDGLVSAQSEGTGWNAVVTAGQGVSGVVRTSNTVVTITLDAFATYDITAQETITVNVPASALTDTGALIATPTFTVDPVVSASTLRLLASTGAGT